MGGARVGLALAAAALAAVLFALASPPYDYAWLAWLVPGLLLLPARGLRPLPAAACGILYAVGIGTLITAWAPAAAATYFDLSPLAARAFILGIHLVNPGLPCVALLVVWAYLAPRTAPGWRPFVGAWLWVGCEWLRAWSLGWMLLGHTQHASLTLIQIADLGGVYAVSFVIACASLAAGEALADRAWRAPAASARRLASPALLVAAAFAYGAWCLATAVPADAGAPRVTIVQGNLDNALRWNRAHFARGAATYVDLTRAASAADAALVVWPENAVSFYLDQEGLLRRQLGATLASADARLLLGAPRRSAAGAFNSAYLLDRDGAIHGGYDKRYLVPMAEYDPLAGWRGAAAPTDVYRAGAAAPPLRTPAFTVAPSICFEILYPELVRAQVRQGAEVLVNLSNDSWMDTGDGAAARQHFAMAVFRAVETRRVLVRAASAGHSGVVGPEGRVRVRLANATAATTTVPVAPRHGETPYVRWGETWWLLVGVGLLVVRRQPAAAPADGRRGAAAWTSTREGVGA